MARKATPAFSLVLVLVLLLFASGPTATGSALHAPLLGRVVDPDGKPIAGVRVEAFRVHRKPGAFADITRVQVTPADGSFRFAKLPTGTEWRLELRKDGWAQDEDPDYRIASGGTEAVVALYPERPFSIRVRCAETGSPIPRTTLRVGHGRHGRLVLPIRKTGTAEWTVRACSGRTRLTICATVPGYHVQLLRREPSESGPLTIRLKPTGDVDVSGVVVDEKGRPVARAQVTALHEPRSGRGTHHPHALTDRKGRFTLVRLMGRETYRIQAQQTFPVPRILASDWITIVPRKDLTVRLVVVRTGKVRARVSVPEGLPPVVTCRLAFARTDRDEPTLYYSGSHYSARSRTARATGLVPGTYDVIAYPFPYPEIHVTGVVVTGGETTKLDRLTVSPGAEIRLTIADARGRTGDDYRIRLLGENHAIASISKRVLPDESVVHSRVPAGTWRILGWLKKDGAIHDLGTVTVEEGKPQTLAREIPEPGRILVRVRDANGKPAVNRDVAVLAARPPPLDRILPHGFRWGYFYTTLCDRKAGPGGEREFVTEANGDVEIGPLSPGTYIVGTDSARMTVKVAAGARVEVVLVTGQ